MIWRVISDRWTIAALWWEANLVCLLLVGPYLLDYDPWLRHILPCVRIRWVNVFLEFLGRWKDQERFHQQVMLGRLLNKQGIKLLFDAGFTENQLSLHELVLGELEPKGIKLYVLILDSVT